MNKVFINREIPALFEAKGWNYSDMLDVMKDTCNDALNGVSANEANAKIREMLFAVLELDPADAENKKLFRRAMKKNNEKLFEVIEDVVEDQLVQGWNNDPFFMDFVELKNMADGDKNEFYTEEEVNLHVSRVARNNHDISVQHLGKGSLFSVKTATYGAAVGTDLRLYLTGRIDFTKMISALTKAFDQKIKNMIYTELAGVGSKLPINSSFNLAMAISDSTKATFDQMLEDVSSANGGSEVMIVGTSAACKKLEKWDDVNWRSNDAKNERYRTGRVGLYEGHPIMEIPQQLKKDNGALTRLISNDQLLVFPVGMDKFIKMVYEGDPQIIEIMEAGERVDDSLKYEYSVSFGVDVIVGKYFGNLKITA